MLKRRTFWIALVVILVLIGAAAALKKRQAKMAELAAAAKVPVTSVLEFLAADVTLVQARDLRQILVFSGSLRAVNQVAVKAKLAGEVREVLVREGETVTAGQVLIKIDSSEYQARLEQSKGAMLASRGQLAIATNARDNNKALLAKGFISQNAFDNAASQYDIAYANLESAKGALDVAQKSLTDTVIRAPIYGLVSSRTVQPGEKVSADNRLLDVVDLRQMEMEAAIPTADIMSVELGQEVLIKVEGLSTPVSGKVVRINPAIQAGSRSILAYIQLNNEQGALRVGMFGEAQLTRSKKTGVLTVPQSAIQNTTGSPSVYAIENSKLVQKTVTLGSVGNDGNSGAVEIVSGLASGAQIVKINLGNLRAGTEVRFAKMPVAASTGNNTTAASAAK